MARVVLVASPSTPPDKDAPPDRTIQFLEELQQAIGFAWSGWNYERTNVSELGVAAGAKGRDPHISLTLTKAETTAIRDQVGFRMFWPVLHGRPDLMRYDADAYAEYCSANQRLAKLLRATLTSNDIVWVQDYLHAPLAAALRQRGFTGPIGILLHAPLPSPDRLLPLPIQEELIRGLLQYDLIGFQSDTCLQNFHDVAAQLYDVRRVRGLDTIMFAGRRVQTGVFPIPNNADLISRLAASNDIVRKSRYLRRFRANREVIVSWGTFDYSQGLVERLRGFERFLEEGPHWHNRTSMIQIVTPCHDWLDEYQGGRVEVESLLSHINGRFATLEWTPIKYIRRTPSALWSAALNRASRVGLITPLSEGTSLTAKDYVCAQDPADPGVLVLSQFAGGSRELNGALFVNPYNSERVAATLRNALSMPLQERVQRWQAMYETLKGEEPIIWSARFIDQLSEMRNANQNPAAA